MRKSKLRPRPDHVAEFTRGVALPLPPLSRVTLQVVAETIERAWNELVADHGEKLGRGDEAEVSDLMVSRLNQFLDYDSCWATVAVGVSRGRESISFDGRHLEKRPDISIHLARRNFDYPLVAECKLIDHPCDKTVAIYCSQGLVRFIRGEYAWISSEAFMLAYVRDGSRIATTLRPRLTNEREAASNPCATESLPTPIPNGLSNFAHSRHGRCFSYLAPAENTNPGAIDIWHLWLSAESVAKV